VPACPQVKRGYNILCKSTKALPYLNKPHMRTSWRRFVWWWVDTPVQGEIASRPAPARIDGSTVTFIDGSQDEFDLILLATGYTQRFPFLNAPRHTHAADPRGGASAPRGIEDPLPPDHFIVDPTEPRLAFIGFVRPNVGAIPPMAELQSLWWIARLRGQVAAHREPPSYGLLGKKLAYGVDYGNYMHQLAAEFGAAPAVSQLAHKPRVLLAYCLGQVHKTQCQHTAGAPAAQPAGRKAPAD
jgi:dimethylaniline monooxygenase (N-oxide forming)